jgi:hypothetical protein
MCVCLGAVHQVGERDLEAALQLEQDAERRVDLPTLDGPDVVAVQPGAVAEFLLREPALASDDPDDVAECVVLGAVVRGHQDLPQAVAAERAFEPLHPMVERLQRRVEPGA